MILTKTPFRISFVGGGSDIASFYTQHPGAVLSTSIDKYMYIFSHKFFDEDKIRVHYSQTETVDNVEDLQHPILKTVLNNFAIKGGIEISSIADIPSGTGMGSSSSFTVGLVHNLRAQRNELASKELLAQRACEIEIDHLKEPIGKQDQYAAAYGGLNVIRFHSSGAVTVDPLYLKPEVYKRLEDNLILFYIGNQRKTSSILKQQKKNINEQDKFNALKQMTDIVFEMRDSLYRENLDDFGKYLHENWQLKQGLASGITNDQIQEIYDTSIAQGAKGGKLLGAGGGGFILFYCEKEKQPALCEALSNLRPFPFTFDKEGSKITYIGNEQLNGDH